MSKIKTNIRTFQEKDKEAVIELIANFRVELARLKGIKKEQNLDMAKEELRDYIDNKYPIFIAEDKGNIIVGYLVCKVERDIVWAESLYVLPEYRRRGIASLLFNEAEKVAEKLGGDTVYNWVHPNNDGIIKFLDKRGYNVLNLIEVRKPWKGEINNQKIKVDKHEFRY